MAEGDYCIMQNGYLVRYPQLKPMTLFKTHEDVGKFRNDLENATREEFKRIDRQKRQSIAASHSIILD